MNNESLKALLWLKWMEKVMNCEIQHADRCHEKRLPEGPIVDSFLSPHQNNTQRAQYYSFTGVTGLVVQDVIELTEICVW